MKHNHHPIFEEIINAACCEMVTLYDKDEGAFVMRNITEINEDENLILVPYREECSHLAMRKFWSSLSEDDRALAESFNEKNGFFNFLRETGLIFMYYDSEEDAITEVLEYWKTSNNLTFDWDTVEYI